MERRHGQPRLSGGPGTASAWFLLGASRTAWAGLSLPYPLGMAGMPGCSMRVSGDVALGVTLNQGAATVPIAIPAAAALVGKSFHAQGVVADAGANALGMVMSDAAAATIGAR